MFQECWDGPDGTQSLERRRRSYTTGHDDRRIQKSREYFYGTEGGGLKIILVRSGCCHLAKAAVVTTQG